MNEIKTDCGVEYTDSQISKEKNEKKPKNQKMREIYFIISYKGKDEKLKDLKFLNAEINIKSIYNKAIKKKQDLFLHQIVFKLLYDVEQKYEEFNLAFEIGIHKYTIKIKVNNKMFHFDIGLEKEIKFLSLFSKEILDQNILNYFQKLKLFLAALIENNEEDKKENLFEEAINLYSKKKEFYFLISLFTIIYEKKNLCCKLIEGFYKINKEKKNDKNMDSEIGLDSYVDIFKDISSRSEEIIKNYGYNPIYFYGLTFSYLNFYDYENFKKYFKQLNLDKCGILYEILLTYSSNFLRQIDQDLTFFENFLDYTIKNKEFSIFENSLNYILDFDIIFIVIDKKKEEIFNKYNNDFKTIKIKPDLKINKKEKEEKIKNIIEAVKSIIDFSRKKQALLIYLNSNFWINILKNYNEPNALNIDICFKLRGLLKNYNELIIGLFENEKNDDEKKIKEDIQIFLENDEYAFILDKNIQTYIESNKKELSDSEILGTIMLYDPYYKEDRYQNSKKRVSNIFDLINFNNIDNQFICTFKKLKFEEIFKEKITSFTDKMLSKINRNIYTFNNIIELIDINKLSDDKLFMHKLKQKFEECIRKINLLKENELQGYIQIIAKFVEILYSQEKNIDFLEKKIDKLNNNIKFLVYIEIIKICQNDGFKQIKDFIFKKYLTNKNIENLIAFIDNLSKKDKIKFYEELLAYCLFTRKEFYSNYENSKIKILIKLYEKGKLNLSLEDINFWDLEELLKSIKNDIDGDIKKKTLEIFLENGKEFVVKRLGLIKIILNGYDPEDVYKVKKAEIKNINEDIKELVYIKNSLLIYHRYSYLDKIQEITEIIKNLKEREIRYYYNSRIKEIIQNFKDLKPICEEVNIYKNNILFNAIYDEECGNDQKERFEKAKSKIQKFKVFILNDVPSKIIYLSFKNIFDKIKDILSNDYLKSEQLINQIKEFCELKKNNELINDLIIIFKSKKYEIDLKSIFFFFGNLNTNDNNWYKNIPEGYETISEKNLEDMKRILNELKENEIYDYQKNNNYVRLFTSLYEKREAIDFLKSKIDQDIKYLNDKIDPIIQNLTLEDIEDTEECIKIFNNFKGKDNHTIFKFIKNKIKEQQINKFENYSKNYLSIIDLDSNYNSSHNLFEKVDKIMQNAKLIFRQDNEDFYYDDKKTNMEELIHMKNNICINKPEEIKGVKNILQIKSDKLLFFKDLISELEVIYDNMKILRIKGTNLPILIVVEIRYPNKIYFLNDKEKNFEDIKGFLFKIKTEQISQLDTFYTQKKHLRFLYGMQFRKIIKHLEDESSIFEIIRYILNIKDSKKIMIDGERCNPKNINDYIEAEAYKIYINNSFNNISNYICSLFEKNNTSLEDHYKKMLIKGEAKYKGFYLYKCQQDESMEEFILYIFLEKIGCLPVAQNVLITNEGTSLEEMQAFLFRAILCDYNTLFVIEINNSFSEYQQNIMNFYINKILNGMEINSEKNKSKIYIKSCIIFVYKQDNSFHNELEKFNIKEMGSILIKDSQSKNKHKKMNVGIENIKIITSDICGLGKSFKIKTAIKSNKKEYYYFPLGGLLTKAIIYEKLFGLLKKIRKEQGENYEKIAIHLDLLESKEISIINEFLFSFLITKFYINSENIIYIPKDIEIYIEISNSFENYFSKLSILKMFNTENIELDNIPKLDLPEDKKKIFSEILNVSTNQEIEEFVKKHIGIEKCSYHQINNFIKIIASQFIHFKSKFLSDDGEKNDNERLIGIAEFSKFIHFYSMNGITKFLIEINNSINIVDKNKSDYNIEFYENELKAKKNDIDLIFNKEKAINEEVIYLDKNSNKLDYTKYYLQRMKKIFDFPNEIKNDEENFIYLNHKDDNYVITNDNFKKMIILFYRIKANIPVIVMGETGWGKTLLIKKLNQILNNGKMSIKTINIHPEKSEKDIYKEMKIINEEAKNKNEEIWILFDEINTSLSFSLITEIFINRTYNGEKISENIRLIGACNPYRKRKESSEIFRLNGEDDNENGLIYLVQPLPQSLLNYVFIYDSIKEEDEKEYIYSIIKDLFNNEENNLLEMTKNAIFECHKFLRETFDPSVVSLREISRFYKCVEFFKNYYFKKDEYLNKKGSEKLYKIKSIICSLYICYYIRLIDEIKRTQFDIRLKQLLIKLINKINEKEEDIKEGDLIESINFEELKEDLRDKKVNQFSDFIKIEEDFLMNLIELDKGLEKNNILKENIFLLFLSVVTKIPLILIGKPGTGKSLSAHLICKSMKGKYSKEKFFRKYPKIIQTFFEGSESTNPEDVEKLFEIAEGKYNSFIQKINKKEITDEDLPISMILFDELGLAEKSKTNPLKILHSNLEKIIAKKSVSFIGISNYSLDAAKLNRFITLSVENFDEKIDQLIITCKGIVEKISEDLYKNQKQIFDTLIKTYYQYKNILNFIKELIVIKQINQLNNDLDNNLNLDKKEFSEIRTLKVFKNLLKKERTINQNFHGNVDLFNLIRGIAIEIGRLSTTDAIDVKDIIEKYIERNFGGIEYEIDIDFKLKFDDIKNELDTLKKIFEDFLNNKKIRRGRSKINDKNNKNEEIFKFTSVFLFKKIYNIECDKEIQNKIDNENCKRYDLAKRIYDNINDCNNSRYLLIGIKPSLSSLIYQTIKILNPEKIIELYDGSPFKDDNNNEYKFKKLSEIKDDAKIEKLIILKNLNQIQSFLYNLYNMNFITKKKIKYSDIYLDNFRKIKTQINDLFKIIILVDIEDMDKIDESLLNRLEKIKISFDKLLDNEQIIKAKRIIDGINIEYLIDNFQKSDFKYNLKDLLINCGKEEIEGFIYNLDISLKKLENMNINEEEIKENLFNKIVNLLPQDIIAILPEEHFFRNIYSDKKYCNFNEYISDDNNKNYKISIIYTFTNLSNVIIGSNNEMSFMVSEIKNESHLINIIDEIKNKSANDKNKFILIHFEHNNSNKIQFITNFILKNYNEDKYNYILLIHIKRNFNLSINDRIYSIPDINPQINQLFLDNLNSKKIIFQEFLERNIIDIMNDEKLIDLDKEFKRILTSFVYKELIEKRKYTISPKKELGLLNEDNYIDEIIKYMDEEDDFKKKIVDKAMEFIKKDEEAQGNSKSLLEKIFKNMNKYSVDIISCLLDYIKEKIFSKYLLIIFKILESNNFLTTLLEFKKNKNDDIDSITIIQLEDINLEKIDIDKKIEEPKFSFKFIIPGFYNFYNKISNYINKNIYIEYYNNENNLRFYFETDAEKEINIFHEKEEILLYNLYDEIKKDTINFYIMITISPKLILKDYITYFLEENEFSKTDINNRLIHLLLKLRFNKKKNEIIKNNLKFPYKIILIQIMWIESNVNYISNIIKIFELASELFIDDGDELLNNIEKIINDEKNEIKYIFDENRNPAHTKEVNECYYILLASICYAVTSDKMILIEKKSDDNEIEINFYHWILIEINKILQNINNDLLLYLNEMYIIDELIEVIDMQKTNKIDIEKIQNIRKFLRKNAEIIQNNQPDKYDLLISNFEDIYRELLIPEEEISKEKGNQFYDKYYDTLRNIFFKEINKITNDNYRAKIFEYLIKEKEIIKKSNNIFQILLKGIVKTKKDFKRTKNNLLEGKNNIISEIEDNLSDNQQDNYLALTESLLHFFEKNSLIYFHNYFHNSHEKEPFIEKEPLDIFKQCIYFIKDILESKRKYERNNKYITIFFCLAYIKIFCNIFIKMFDANDAKFKEPEKVIESLNEDKPIFKMIRLYIYKILFNKYKIDVFIDKNKIITYKLDEYKDFKNLIKYPEDEKINYGFETLDNENYVRFFEKLIEKKKSQFKKKIVKEEIGNNLHIDNFYIASCNMILLLLKNKDFENSDIYKNFYKNICKPLYENNKFSNLIQILFNPDKYKEVKEKYNINSMNIEAILYGFRFCINELLADEIDEDNDYIYSSLYDRTKIGYLAEKYYPGSDTKDEPYFELFSKIYNHFEVKPKEGCYVCLCRRGFYHSVPSGFPGIKENNMTCPYCEKEIGSKKTDIFDGEKEVKTVYQIVKRDGYVRIFKNEEEIESLKKNKDKSEKIHNINYMTLKMFEKQYMKRLYEKEKGLKDNLNIDYYSRDDKKIRNISKISYRLLNYILYSHLFFAKIFTNQERFDRYKPTDISWGEFIYKNYKLLKNELEKKGVNSMKIFMNYIFKDLFEKLHEKKSIDEFKELINFEYDLEDLIQDKIEKSLEEIKKYNKIIEINSNDKNDSINLLNEKYDKNNYKREEYPYYEYFYYSDYLDENSLIDNISKIKENYPMLNKYLEYNMKKIDIADKYSLNKFNLFNKVLNMITERYSYKITKEYAEKTPLKETEIYNNAELSKLIDKFIKFYNDLKITDNNGNEMRLTNKNKLEDFVIDDNNEIGKSYKNIYTKFITKQNNEIKDLLDIKINEGIFNTISRNKIYSQQIKNDEIFILNTSEKFSFIDIIYNCSYRKIIDSPDKKIYNSFEIILSLIEDNMTKLLLKNKKLVYEDLIIGFNYNNTIFEYKSGDLITTFNISYKTKDISLEDKDIINKFIKNNKGNLEKYKSIINDFISLFEFLNNNKKDKQDKGKAIIYDIITKNLINISNEFSSIFAEKKKITVNKLFELFNYYIQSIFEDVKDEINNFQEKIDIESDEEKQIIKERYIILLNEYFKEKKSLISKEDLKNAIRIFITLVLFREKDKENKIRLNRKNIFDYLKSPDLWNNKLYQEELFKENLDDLKSFDIPINRILFLYNYLIAEDNGK